MPDFDPPFNSLNTCGLDDEPASSAYTMLLLLTGVAVAMYAFARYAESKNELNYDTRAARISAGILSVILRMFHTTNGDLEITNAENKIIAIGPHRTSLDALVVASKIKGAPPRFFATTAFNGIPGVKNMLNMFQTIPIDSSAKKEKGRSSNAGAIDLASKVLNEQGCVALFPQGNFSLIGQEPPRIYTGVAQLAIKNNLPIQVARLDGFWCLQNPVIPLWIRNRSDFRAFASLFHLNNVRVTSCGVIDSHLKPENADLSDELKIEAICAELYSYYRHTQELTVKQIETIKEETPHTRLGIWKNKLAQDEARKQLTTLKKEEAELDKTTVSMTPQ
ncbi:MAG: lysophospholipid acyltransferase family protein [Legionella sp.]|nr:lysophospholipid acyltransferase family protein [Legionella sp.]